MGQTLNLQDLQKKMESQVGRGGLCKPLRYGSGGAGLCRSSSAGRPGQSPGQPSELPTTSLPPPLLQQATLAELLKLLKPSGGLPALAGLGMDDGGLGACQVAQPSLSLVKGWDYRDLAMPLRRRRGTASAAGGGGKPADRPGSSSGFAASKRDRCASVEGYWRALRPEERRAILRVPIAKMVEGAPLRRRRRRCCCLGMPQLLLPAFLAGAREWLIV